VLVLVLGYSLSVADDRSARRYAEFAEHDDLFRTFSLLERKDVQDELKLAPEQVAKAKHIWRPPEREVPGLPELIARYRTLQADPSLSDADRKKARDKFSADLGSCYAKYQHHELAATLSTVQKQRLDELLLQMRGPIAIVDDSAVSSKLQLSDQQLAEMRDTAKQYAAELGWLQARYGRQQISDRRYKGETREDRQGELAALFTVICAIEKERDASLVITLAPQQFTSWTTMQGKAFPIVWPAATPFDYPFDEKE
jgi:hypothetical protein